MISDEVIPGNTTTTISDNLPLFYLFPKYFQIGLVKNPIFMKELVCQNFILDYFDKDWFNVFQCVQEDVNLSIESSVDNMDFILEDQISLEWVHKCKLKFKTKPRNSFHSEVYYCQKIILKKFINSKEPGSKKFVCKRLLNYFIYTFQKKQNKLLQSIFQC